MLCDRACASMHNTTMSLHDLALRIMSRCKAPKLLSAHVSVQGNLLEPLQ